MAKPDNGITEDQMVDLTEDKEESKETVEKKDAEEQTNERMRNLAKVLDTPDELVTPTSSIVLAQKARRYAMVRAIEEDPDNAAVTHKDLFKDFTQTAIQQQRNEVEAQGNKELAAAIAKNNENFSMRKSPDVKVDKKSAPGNSVKDRVVSFGNTISEEEISTEIENPDYEQLVKEEEERDKERKAGNKPQGASSLTEAKADEVSVVPETKEETKEEKTEEKKPESEDKKED